MKIRFTVTLTDETVSNFVQAGCPTGQSVAAELSKHLQGYIDAINHKQKPIEDAILGDEEEEDEEDEEE